MPIGIWVLLALQLVLGCGAHPGSPVNVAPRTDAESSLDGPPSALPVATAGEMGDASAVALARLPSPPPRSEVPSRLSCLMAAYPVAIRSAEERGGSWFVTLQDGQEVPWDDHQGKDAEARLDSPDLEDTTAQSYPVGQPFGAVAPGEDPGRVRHPVLFENAYGEDERAVRAGLVEVPWPGGDPVRVSSRNGAADALRAVIVSLGELSPETRRCLAAPIGSFSFRVIRGTARLSAHAYGVAIDLNTSCGEYWRWRRPHRPLEESRMPASIVDAFEAQGFIWGGRWHRYDTFHFEYRPEFFVPECRAERGSGAPVSE